MYTVKKLEKNTEIKRIELKSGKVAVSRTPRQVWAIVDENDQVVYTPDFFDSKKLRAEIYDRKHAAESTAKWLNEQS